jgi:glycosyltransferase involved in cell wall biosynthesis
MLAPKQLASLWSTCDLHVYLTVPFVLSWSVFNALACGVTVLASDTPPVRELITDGENGLLADFFDLEAPTVRALEVLNDPVSYRGLGAAGSALIQERYSLQRCLPQMLDLYESVLK